MTALQASYPLYLANEAEAPNQDLAVTDKFTGEVATRVAQADAATIDAGIAAAVEAAEPMARMAAYERQAVLAHCVDPLHRAVRRTGHGALHRGRQADQGLPRRGRPADRHLPHRRRGSRCG